MVIAFQVEANLACFKKYYSTASILSFDIPPKTAIVGMIGAILGIPRRTEKLLALFQAKTAVIIQRPVRKMMMGMNLLNTKARGKMDAEVKRALDHVLNKTKRNTYAFVGAYQHSQINTQVLIAPKYLLLVKFPSELDNVATELAQRLQEKRYAYTPYLGRSEHICQVTSLQVNGETKVAGKVSVDSIIPVAAQGFEPESILSSSSTNPVILETLPHTLRRIGTGKKKDFEYTFAKYLYQRDGQSLTAETAETFEYDLNGEGKKTVVFS